MTIKTIFAYTLALYGLASSYYLVRTACIGTPLKDSLTKEQLDIRAKAKKERKRIFMTGVVLAIFLLLLLRPF